MDTTSPGSPRINIGATISLGDHSACTLLFLFSAMESLLNLHVPTPSTPYFHEHDHQHCLAYINLLIRARPTGGGPSSDPKERDVARVVGVILERPHGSFVSDGVQVLKHVLAVMFYTFHVVLCVVSGLPRGMKIRLISGVLWTDTGQSTGRILF